MQHQDNHRPEQTSPNAELPLEDLICSDVEGGDAIATNDPALAAEMAEFEAAVSAIAYAAPPMPMASDLKQRLMMRIAQDDSPCQETSELLMLLQQSIDDLKQKASELHWRNMKQAVGFEMATWKIDKARRETAFFVRAETALKFPNHAHATGEVILVLDGDVVVGEQIYGPGDRITSAAGSIHGPATRTGCLLLCVSSLDDRMVE